jgi:hypothetical protein
VRVGEFIAKCDVIEGLITEASQPELSRGDRAKLEVQILDLTGRLLRMGYTIPKPAWDGTGL